MRLTKTVYVGGIPIGGGHPVTIQSMTNTDTADIEATLAQITALHKAGCDMVRIAVYDEVCADAVRRLCEQSPVPLIADIHFNYHLAIRAIENGIQKVRINPGNIGGASAVRELAACLKAHRVPVRIGVNSGSIQKAILQRDGGITPRGMVDSALEHARLLESEGFDAIVLSLKSSDVTTTFNAYTLAAQNCDYPLHLGVTEAGLPEQGTVASAIGIGALLLNGIGDTLRVSLTGDPVREVEAAAAILEALKIRSAGVRLIACPTCGRSCMDVERIAKVVMAEFRGIRVPLTLAVMGCAVNGPGEAREADIGLAGTPDGCVLFMKGSPLKKIEGDPVNALITAARTYIKELDP